MIQEILNKFIGSAVDGDGYPVGAKYQCTDWVARFVKEAFDKNTTRMRVSGGAKDIFLDWPNSFVLPEWNTERIYNAPDNFPLQGDIIVWNSNMGGGYGHTAVVESANVNTVTVIEQNGGSGWGNGKGNDAIRRHLYGDYTNVLGWVRIAPIIVPEEAKPYSYVQNGFAVYDPGPNASTDTGTDSKTYIQNGFAVYDPGK